MGNWPWPETDREKLAALLDAGIVTDDMLREEAVRRGLLPGEGFKACVLAWLQQRQPRAVEVESVTGDGSDWEGSTEGGFYSRFSVEIRWKDATGRSRSEEIYGSDMEDLWGWVVKGWEQR